MIKTILAIAGIYKIFEIIIKYIARATLRAEHKDDFSYYEIFDKDGNKVWESGKVAEFSYDEHIAFQQFCKEWAKYPSATAKWDRVRKDE